MGATSMYPLPQSEQRAVSRRLAERILDFRFLDALMQGSQPLEAMGTEAEASWVAESRVAFSEWVDRAVQRGLVAVGEGPGDRNVLVTSQGILRRNSLAHDPDIMGLDEGKRHRRRRVFRR